MALAATSVDLEIAKTVKLGKKERTLWDHSIPGLGLRISPKGKASFILMYRFEGALRKLTIGRYGSISISQAKDFAKKHHAEIVAGVDPAEKKREAKLGDTVKDLCNQYACNHLPKKKQQRDDKRFIAKVTQELGRKKVSAVTYQDIVRFHRTYDAPVQANRCLSFLQKLFNLAKDWGMLDRAAINPANGVKKNPEKSRNRYISEIEMPRLLAVIDQWPDVFIRSALYVCLFTGIRQKSVMSLKWEDIDLEAGILRETAAKTSKAGEIVTHALTKATVEALLDLPRNPTDPYVFTDGRLVRSQTKNLWYSWGLIKEKAGIRETAEDRLWLHDLRRTLGSWLVKNNYSTNVAKTALNHKSLVAAQRYQHITDGDLVQRAMEDVTQKMLATRKPSLTN